MIDYYEQLTQEEKRRGHRCHPDAVPSDISPGRKFDKRAERMQYTKNTVPVRSIWNFLKHIFEVAGIILREKCTYGCDLYPGRAVMG